MFYKKLIYLAVPIIVQDLVNTSVNLADSFMVGSLGLDSINGVGFGNQIFFLFAVLLFGINSGSSIFIGQFFGKKDFASVRKVLGISIVLSMLSASAFAFAAWFVPEKLIGMFTNEPEVIRIGAGYIRIVAVSYFITAVTMPMNMALKSCNQPRLPLLTTFVSLLINCSLNLMFIFVLKWGVNGVALSTVIARVVEVLLQLVLINVLKMPVAGKIRDYLTATRGFVKNYLFVTLPVIANEFAWALGTTTYAIAYKYAGNEAQGAVQISNSIQSFFMVMGMGIGSACAIMLSNLLGAGENKTAITYSRKCLKMVIAASLLMGLLLFIFAPALVSIYNVTDEVKETALNIIVIIAVGLIIKTYNFTTIVGILRSGGDTRFCLMLDMCSVWLIGVPLAFLGAAVLKLPITYVVAMVYMEEVFKIFLSSKRVFSNVWAVTVV